MSYFLCLFTYCTTFKENVLLSPLPVIKTQRKSIKQGSRVSNIKLKFSLVVFLLKFAF